MRVTGNKKLIMKNKNRSKNHLEKEVEIMTTIKKNLNLIMINQIGIKTKLLNKLQNKIQKEEEEIEVTDKIEMRMGKMVIKTKSIQMVVGEEEIEATTIKTTIIKTDHNLTEAKIIIVAIMITTKIGKEVEEIGEVVEEDIVEDLEEIKTDKITVITNKEEIETLVEEIKITTDNKKINLKTINLRTYPIKVRSQSMMLFQLFNQKELNLGLKSVCISESVKSQ